MSNQDALSELIQRFAVSALSIERKNEAVNEEILVGKYTGDFHIKTKDGIVLSADNLNREKSSTDEAIRIAELMGMTGDCFKVEFESHNVPNHIDYSVNILQNDIVELPADTKEVLINIDLDEYNIVGDEVQIIHSKDMVKIVFEVIIGEFVNQIQFNKELGDLNFNVFSLNEQGDASSIKLIDITISKDINEKRAMLLHNMFVTVNK